MKSPDSAELLRAWKPEWPGVAPIVLDASGRLGVLCRDSSQANEVKQAAAQIETRLRQALGDAAVETVEPTMVKSPELLPLLRVMLERIDALETALSQHPA